MGIHTYREQSQAHTNAHTLTKQPRVFFWGCWLKVWSHVFFLLVLCAKWALQTDYLDQHSLIHCIYYVCISYNTMKDESFIHIRKYLYNLRKRFLDLIGAPKIRYVYVCVYFCLHIFLVSLCISHSISMFEWLDGHSKFCICALS